MPGTWFLPPDFTYTADGALQLGMVLPHWSKPGTVLADVSDTNARGITLPNTAITHEPKHAYNRSKSRSNGVGVWSKIEGIASVSASGDLSNGISINYSEADHEVRTFSQAITTETAAAIEKLPAVRAHIESGLFGRRAPSTLFPACASLQPRSL